MFPAKTQNSPLNPDDHAIIATLRASATGHGDAAAHRRALRDKARLFYDVKHFCRLCIGDLEDAFNEDRHARKTRSPAATRQTKNRRRSWQAAFRSFAQHNGIRQSLQIVALDRQGHYACHLIDKAAPDEWEKLVRLAQSFSIDEKTLRNCLPAADAVPVRQARTRNGTARAQSGSLPQ